VDAGWDTWFETVLRAELTELADDEVLDPDQPLALYGLTSLSYLALGEQLSQHYGVPTRFLVQRSFRTARSLWSFVTTQVPDQPLPASTPVVGQRQVTRVGSGRTLAEHFAAAAKQHPEATCLIAGASSRTYRHLLGEVAALARTLRSLVGANAGGPAPVRIAVLGERALATYRGYLAVLYAGATVVPLSMESPPARNAAIVTRAGAALVLVAGHGDDPELVAQRTALGEVTALLDIAVVSGPMYPSELPAPVSLDATAYLLFTSGSTGDPKGVGITHRNVDAFLAGSLPRYELGAGDVFSQVHELTFDLSVFELWGAWATGATLVAVPRLRALDPAETVSAYGITVWTCTPSLMAAAGAAGRIPPGSMAGVRYVAFCGEPLSEATARLTVAAAPDAAVDNTYGPTEATVWCTFHRISAGGPSADESVGGIVAIGQPCPGTDVLLLADDGSAAVQGELCLAGDQVFTGYLDPALDGSKFVEHGGRRWYRTGDLVTQGPAGLRHLGRLDDQVKVRGFRIELPEVEHAASALLTGRRTAAVVTADCAGASELVLFVEGDPVDGNWLRSRLAELLPGYMVPARVRSLARFSLTANGKLDRAALAEHAAEQSRATAPAH
jgi:amino acid adenylation domain-containing protein